MNFLSSLDLGPRELEFEISGLLSNERHKEGTRTLRLPFKERKKGSRSLGDLLGLTPVNSFYFSCLEVRAHGKIVGTLAPKDEN